MSYENPTALRLGATGTIDGRRFTVRGRVVMSMVADDGETYYWQEFNLADDAGAAVTLVWEETETGPIWKWFTLYAPRQPLTPEEAARKSVGDTVTFEGRPIVVTLVDSSTVSFIEGEAPEDVEVGDEARYFNADAGGRLFVASWGDDYIEFYLGRDLPPGRVESAFNLIAPSGAGALRSDGEASGGSSRVSPRMLVVGGLVLFVLFALFISRGGSGSNAGASAPPAVRRVTATVLTNGARGSVDGRDYEIVGRNQVMISSPGRTYATDEYLLRGADGGEALLLQGLTGGPGWIVLRPAEPPVGFTPFDAAALRRGQALRLAEKAPVVGQLFIATSGPIDNQAMAARWPVRVLYGFVARLGPEVFVCRWGDEHALQFYAGSMLAQKDVVGAFGGAK